MSKDSLKQKRDGKLDVVIIGDYDKKEKLFIKTFPLLKNNKKHKYLNRFDLFIREEIQYPKEFLIQNVPELNDKMADIDILILTYNTSNKISFEFLKKFYYLYYNKLEEKDKPKNIIIIEFDYTSKDSAIKIDSNDSQQIKTLFKGYFYNNKDSDEKLTDILKECLKNLINIYNFEENYKYFYDFQSDNIIIDLLIYGEKELQNLFIKIILDSKFYLEYTKLEDNFYEIKYSKEKNNVVSNFKIKLKIMKKGSICNISSSIILLYDINDKESYNSIEKIIREYILLNGPKFIKIFNIVSINTISGNIKYNENDIEIKNGKYLSDELGANYSIINVNNNDNLKEEIKMIFDNIFEKIIDKINNKNKSKIIYKNNEEIINMNEIRQVDYYSFKNYDSPLNI